jgi:hypothetical protein
MATPMLSQLNLLAPAVDERHMLLLLVLACTGCKGRMHLTRGAQRSARIAECRHANTRARSCKPPSGGRGKECASEARDRHAAQRVGDSAHVGACCTVDIAQTRSHHGGTG